MSDLLVSARNWLTENPPISGIRPTINTAAPNEDPDFPLRNVLERQREKFWKRASGSGQLDVDFDLGASTTYRFGGIARHRQHGGEISSVEVFTATGTTYPPGAWTSRGTLSISDDVNSLLDMGASGVSCRQMRFRITNTGRFSCRFWVGRVADTISLSGEGAEVTEELLRSRSGMTATLLDDITYVEWSNTVRRRFTFSHLFATTAAKGLWQAALGKTLMIRWSDGIWEESVHMTPAFRSARMPGATAIDTHTLQLETLP